MLSIMKNDKNVVHTTVLHGWFVRGTKQFRFIASHEDVY